MNKKKKGPGSSYQTEPGTSYDYETKTNPQYQKAR
jgi:hypothetical protein